MVLIKQCLLKQHSFFEILWVDALLSNKTDHEPVLFDYDYMIFGLLLGQSISG